MEIAASTSSSGGYGEIGLQYQHQLPIAASAH